MKTLIGTIALAVVMSPAQAQTTYQEAQAMQDFCRGQTTMAMMIHIGHKFKDDPEYIKSYDGMVKSNVGAISEWAIAYMNTDGVQMSQEAFMNKVWAKCMDNARRVLLEAKAGRRLKVELLR